MQKNLNKVESKFDDKLGIHDMRLAQIKQVLKLFTLCTTFFLSLTFALNANAHDHGHNDHESPVMGLQLYSLRNQMAEDTKQALAYVKKWGINAVEGGGMLHGKSLMDFKALLEEHDIEIVSVDTSFEEMRDNPMGAAYKAHYYGAKYATIYWVPHNGDIGFTIDDANATIKVLNEGGKVLKEHGITLQYHPHGYELTEYQDGTLLDHIIQNVTEADIQMDVFWIKQGGGNPVEILRKYEGRFTSLHLKDRLPGSPNSSTGSADVETNVVLGDGDVGISEVIKEARKQGIKYYFIEDESSRVLTQIPKSIQYIKPQLQ